MDTRSNDELAASSDTAGALVRCPVCRARLSGATLCPRCSADLTSVAAVAQAVVAAEGRAVHYLAEGRTEAAAAALGEARTLSRTPFSEILAGFVANLRREDQ